MKYVKNSLLIINRDQFGYHTDSYKYCQYLKEEFEITYICFDAGHQKVEEPGIQIIYLPWKGAFLKKGITFLTSCIKYSNSKQFDHIFLVYFQLASFFKLFSSSKNVILDIRTGSVNKSKIKRLLYNYLIRIDSIFFNRITVISESLARQLKLNKIHILPLGANILSYKNKSFKSLKLFYVGTLDYRNIHQTILGLKQFLELYNHNSLKVSYDIFGSGQKSEEDLIADTIRKTGLTKEVVFHGRKEHSELKYFFDSCNIGVSYVPITEYFDCQPPTKTFEYINSGMVCIATNTEENQKLIKFNNGVLCQDNPDDFSRSLQQVVANLKRWDSTSIRSTLSNCTWFNISVNLMNYILDRN